MSHHFASKRLYFIIPFLIASTLMAQGKKRIEATRISNAPKIDGVLDDSIWQTLPVYGNFYMYEPSNEGTIPENYKTEVKLAYDDKAVYVAAYMFDPNAETIPSQFSQRDDVFVQADFFSIAVNTYNDGVNETHFFVTSSGTIGDAVASRNEFDFSHNTVFESRVSKDGNGWYAEFKIPYNALRFPEISVQDWSVNFYRKLIRQNETHTWNFIDNSVGHASQYNGSVTGIKNIDPPVRLILFPFTQGQITNFDGKTETNFTAGMDIKYGLSDSFTLDATLIPDFGQASFDEVRLNLGPFEQTFGENRQFFTEGTDLFNKGNIFFSRRVGGSPSGDVGELSESEIISIYPGKVNLLNALKISGRTKDKLGVGFFNAISEKTYATINDTIGNTSRKVLVEPISNYNIVVLDQQFNDNSSISLINTNVTRDGNFRDSNVSAFVFDLADKVNRFRSSGRAIVSNVNTVEGMTTGFLSEIDISRIKGRFRYGIGHDFANTTYDINDLGVNFQNNYNNFEGRVSYQIFKPNKWFNAYRIQLTANHLRLYRPDVQTGNSLNLSSFFFTKSRFAFGLDFGYNSKSDDYYEPRVAGRYVTFGSNLGGNAWVSSDYRKKFAYDIKVGYREFYDSDPRKNIFLDMSPRYRFSDKLLFIIKSELSIRKQDFGYVEATETDIFFGQRERTDIENSIQASYNFDPYKAIDLRFRNFWSVADYSDDIFFKLNEDGSRSQTPYNYDEVNDPNANFNIWNLDLSFRWRFAPGSEAILLYRNQIFNFDSQSNLNYRESLSNLFGQPQQNTLSLRITYFIDYNKVKDLFSNRYKG